MATEERDRRFYQFDHLRVFGEEDFEDRVLGIFASTFKRIDLRGVISDDLLQRSAIPPRFLAKNSGVTPYLFVKN